MSNDPGFPMPNIPRSVRSLPWRLLAIFGSIALVLAVVAIYLFVDTWRFTSNAGRAEGTVANVVWGIRTRLPAAYPVIRFQAPSGVIEFKARTGTSPPRFQVGDKVAILYRPEDPRDARIDSFVDLYLTATIFGFLAGVFGGVAAMVFVIVRGQTRQARGAKSDAFGQIERR